MIAGGIGNDTLDGGPADLLLGEIGDDSLPARRQRCLPGGEGNDHMTAGAATTRSGEAGTIPHRRSGIDEVRGGGGEDHFLPQRRRPENKMDNDDGTTDHGGTEQDPNLQSSTARLD